MDEFVHTLISATEKSADILRGVLHEDRLREILKKEIRFPKRPGICDKNTRFIQGSKDFAAFIRVLVQEVARHEIGSKFPGIGSSIFGPESSTLTNQLGHNITVQVGGTKEEMTDLFKTILSTEPEGILLADIVHDGRVVERDPDLDALKNISVPLQNLGIWINPIDGTQDFVQGGSGDASNATSRLLGVTVHLGVYEKETGRPIAGVINQPFHRLDPQTQKWSGRYFWGVGYGDVRVHAKSLNELRSSGEKKVILSTLEGEQVRRTLLNGNYSVSESNEFGYQLLSVVLGEADAHVLSDSSAHFWDTCGPHALLRALGGDVLDYKKAKNSSQEYFASVYKAPTMFNTGKIDRDSCSHKTGIIAYKDKARLEEVIAILKNAN